MGHDSLLDFLVSLHGSLIKLDAELAKLLFDRFFNTLLFDVHLLPVVHCIIFRISTITTISISTMGRKISSCCL